MHVVVYADLEESSQVVNEEGLPFVDIQEFEDEEGISLPLPAEESSTGKTSVSTMLAATSGYIKPRLARQMPSLPIDAADAGSSSPPKANTSAKPSSSEATASKRVTFTSETKIASTTDDTLPVIGSSSALAAKSAPASSKPAISQVQERPMKGMIVEKDTTKPPPVLTAAERTMRPKSSLAEAQTFDGLVSHNGKTVNMSAYLPRSMRGLAKVSSNDKGKGRASEADVPEQEENSEEDEDDDDQDQEGDESDSDGLYQYDDTDDEEDENYHIDDVLAMREAALLYHSKRYDLGAGSGTGPLGGNKRPDEYDEVRDALLDMSSLAHHV